MEKSKHVHREILIRFSVMRNVVTDYGADPIFYSVSNGALSLGVK